VLNANSSSSPISRRSNQTAGRKVSPPRAPSCVVGRGDDNANGAAEQQQRQSEPQAQPRSAEGGATGGSEELSTTATTDSESKSVFKSPFETDVRNDHRRDHGGRNNVDGRSRASVNLSLAEHQGRQSQRESCSRGSRRTGGEASSSQASRNSSKVEHGTRQQRGSKTEHHGRVGDVAGDVAGAVARGSRKVTVSSRTSNQADVEFADSASFGVAECDCPLSSENCRKSGHSSAAQRKCLALPLRNSVRSLSSRHRLTLGRGLAEDATSADMAQALDFVAECLCSDDGEQVRFAASSLWVLTCLHSRHPPASSRLLDAAAFSKAMQVAKAAADGQIEFDDSSRRCCVEAVRMLRNVIAEGRPPEAAYGEKSRRRLSTLSTCVAAGTFEALLSWNEDIAVWRKRLRRELDVRQRRKRVVPTTRRPSLKSVDRQSMVEDQFDGCSTILQGRVDDVDDDWVASGRRSNDLGLQWENERVTISGKECRRRNVERTADAVQETPCFAADGGESYRRRKPQTDGGSRDDGGSGSIQQQGGGRKGALLPCGESRGKHDTSADEWSVASAASNMTFGGHIARVAVMDRSLPSRTNSNSTVRTSNRVPSSWNGGAGENGESTETMNRGQTRGEQSRSGGRQFDSVDSHTTRQQESASCHSGSNSHVDVKVDSVASTNDRGRRTDSAVSTREVTAHPSDLSVVSRGEHSRHASRQSKHKTASAAPPPLSSKSPTSGGRREKSSKVTSATLSETSTGKRAKSAPRTPSEASKRSRKPGASSRAPSRPRSRDISRPLCRALSSVAASPQATAKLEATIAAAISAARNDACSNTPPAPFVSSRNNSDSTLLFPLASQYVHLDCGLFLGESSMSPCVSAHATPAPMTKPVSTSKGSESFVLSSKQEQPSQGRHPLSSGQKTLRTVSRAVTPQPPIQRHNSVTPRALSSMASADVPNSTTHNRTLPAAQGLQQSTFAVTSLSRIPDRRSVSAGTQSHRKLGALGSTLPRVATNNSSVEESMRQDQLHRVTTAVNEGVVFQRCAVNSGRETNGCISGQPVQYHNQAAHNGVTRAKSSTTSVNRVHSTTYVNGPRMPNLGVKGPCDVRRVASSRRTLVRVEGQ